MSTYQSPIAFSRAINSAGTSQSKKWLNSFITKRQEIFNQCVERLFDVKHFSDLKPFVQWNQKLKNYFDKHLADGIGALPYLNAALTDVQSVGHILADIPSVFSQSEKLLAEIGTICFHSDMSVSSNIDEYYQPFLAIGSQLKFE
ncbi:hypothetical protein GEMRC1_000828 [Eukaryota sp. GEM-RC1]